MATATATATATACAAAAVARTCPQAAPLVVAQALGGKQVPAPFCSGSAVCFTPVGSDTTGFNLNRGAEARDLATRITGTL
jgi:hypothetical protein